MGGRRGREGTAIGIDRYASCCQMVLRREAFSVFWPAEAALRGVDSRKIRSDGRNTEEGTTERKRASQEKRKEKKKKREDQKPKLHPSPPKKNTSSNHESSQGMNNNEISEFQVYPEQIITNQSPKNQNKPSFSK